MATIINGGEKPQTVQPQEQNVNIHEAPHGNHPVEENAPRIERIAVPTIINQAVPLVVFVGPSASGKSMILVRLAKYLRNNGYTVKPDLTFLNTEEYREGCREFANKLNTNVALDGTVEFLLVDVLQNGRLVAKLLEAPGEDFYTTDPIQIGNGKNNTIEPYLSAIMASNNPKSYVMLLDLDSDVCFRNNIDHREAYSQRLLTHFYPVIDQRRDKTILLYNKIDTTQFGSINGCSDPEGAKNDAQIYYPQLFATMRRRTCGGFITVDDFVFKTFCTGMFSIQYDNEGNQYQTYNTANDCFPAELWREITKKWWHE